MVTHGIDWRIGAQTTKPVSIGDYSLISSNVCIAPGTRIGDHIVAGMGGTLAGNLNVRGSLYLQERVKQVQADLEGIYFSRAEGQIVQIVLPDLL